MLCFGDCYNAIKSDPGLIVYFSRNLYMPGGGGGLDLFECKEEQKVEMWVACRRDAA